MFIVFHVIQCHLNVCKKYDSFCIAVDADSIQTGVLLAPIWVELDHYIFGHEVGVVKNREHLNARPADVVLDFGDMITDLKFNWIVDLTVVQLPCQWVRTMPRSKFRAVLIGFDQMGTWRAEYAQWWCSGRRFCVIISTPNDPDHHWTPNNSRVGCQLWLRVVVSYGSCWK